MSGNQPYRKVPQSWVTNPYDLVASDFGLLVQMSLWSGANETDGRLTVTQARAICDLMEIDPTHRSRHLGRLVSKGALSKDEDGGFTVVDFCDSTHEEREQDRHAWAEKKRAQREKRRMSPGGHARVSPGGQTTGSGATVASTWLDRGERPQGDIRPIQVQNRPDPSHVSPTATQRSEAALQRSFASATDALARAAPLATDDWAGMPTLGRVGPPENDTEGEMNTDVVLPAAFGKWREKLDAMDPFSAQRQRYLAKLGRCPHCDAHVLPTATLCHHCGRTWAGTG